MEVVANNIESRFLGWGNQISDKDVIDACLKQDTAKLKQYHEAGVNFDKIHNYHGESLLHIAISENKFNSFHTLLNLGVNIDNPHLKNGCTPLNYAAMYNRVNFAEALIEHNADVNSRDKYGYTPLNNAMAYENYGIAQTLLKIPTLDVNIPAKNGTPPVFMAYVDDRMDVVDKIIKHPTFDKEFNLILLNDTELYELKDYLHAKAPESDLAMLDIYQQTKVFALKYELDICVSFKDLENHQYTCFGMEGYANRLGAQAMADSFQLFYDYIVQPSHIPFWAEQAFVSVNNSLQFSASVFDPQAYFDKIKLGEIVIIPSGWDGHSITFVIDGDKLYRCNRGHLSDGIHGIEEFVITKPENLNLSLITDMIVADGKPYHLQNEIIDILGLQKVGEIENPTQVVGNCVWASLEGGVEASLLAYFIDSGMDVTQAHSLAKDCYHIWEHFDLNYSLKEIVKSPEVFTQNEIFDDLIIHSLEQHHNPFSESDIIQGVVVLDNLDDPLVFETFDKFIGQDLLKYDPYAYQSISYMKPYAPAIEPSYAQSLYNWLFPAKPNFSNAKLTEVTAYYDFLKACDNYLEHNVNAGNVINMADILDISDTKPLETLFSALKPETLPTFNQSFIAESVTVVSQMISKMISIEETHVVNVALA